MAKLFLTAEFFLLTDISSKALKSISRFPTHRDSLFQLTISTLLQIKMLYNFRRELKLNEEDSP